MDASAAPPHSAKRRAVGGAELGAEDPGSGIRLKGWRRLVASRRFQAWAARFPLTRPAVRREGERLMDLVSGFVQSQVVLACVELRVFDALADGAKPAERIASEASLPPERAKVLLDAGVALGLLNFRHGRYRLSLLGTALIGVPGLAEMIRHHAVLYRDLADPAAFFRGDLETELSLFWPYVMGGVDPAAAQRYSRLMADSQALVAEETLAAVRLRGTRHLMDVGGGTGAFLVAVARRYPDLKLSLADLPEVLEAASARLAGTGHSDAIELAPVDFRAALPSGADAVSLVRVLYDHDDETVAALLARVRKALPPSGRVIVSEPMLGTRATDTYFAVYTLAMGTGQTRSPARIAEMLGDAGFVDVTRRKTSRPFITSVVEGRVPESVLQD